MKATIVVALTLITAVAVSAGDHHAEERSSQQHPQQQWSPMEENNQHSENDVADTGNPATKAASLLTFISWIVQELGGGGSHYDGGQIGKKSGNWDSGLTDKEPGEEEEEQQQEEQLNDDEDDNEDPIPSSHVSPSPHPVPKMTSQAAMKFPQPQVPGQGSQIAAGEYFPKQYQQQQQHQQYQQREQEEHRQQEQKHEQQELQQPKQHQLQSNSDPMPVSPDDEGSEPGYRMFPMPSGYMGGGYAVGQPVMPGVSAIPAMSGFSGGPAIPAIPAIQAVGAVPAVPAVAAAPPFPAVAGGMVMGPGFDGGMGMSPGYDSGTEFLFPQSVEAANLTSFYDDYTKQQERLQQELDDKQRQVEDQQREIRAKMMKHQAELQEAVDKQAQILQQQQQQLEAQEKLEQQQLEASINNHKEVVHDLTEKAQNKSATATIGMAILDPHVQVIPGHVAAPGALVPAAAIPGAMVAGGPLPGMPPPGLPLPGLPPPGLPHPGPVLPVAGLPAGMPLHGGPMDGYPMPGSLGGPMLGLEVAEPYPFRRRHPFDHGGLMDDYEESPDLQRMLMMEKVKRLRAQRKGFARRNRMSRRRQWRNDMYDDY